MQAHDAELVRLKVPKLVVTDVPVRIGTDSLISADAKANKDAIAKRNMTRTILDIENERQAKGKRALAIGRETEIIKVTSSGPTFISISCRDRHIYGPA